MRNCDIFRPGCADKALKELVERYAFRGLFDNRGCYYPEKLLERQHGIYLRWKETTGCGNCSFYEWMLRDGDTAFILKPGDLVSLYGGMYCVVEGIVVPNFVNRDYVFEGRIVKDAYPQKANHVLLRFPDGKTMEYLVGSPDLRPADIPPEVFALACGKAKDCPMLKGN